MSTEQHSLTTETQPDTYQDRLSLAEASSTPAPMLEQLSTDTNPLIRRAVAQNPNAPLAALLLLSAAHPKEVLQNPALPLWFLEDPAFFLRFSEAGLLAMLRCRGFPREYLALLAAHRSEKVRLRVALSPGLPRDCLRSLLQNDWIARTLAAYPRTPPNVLYFLMGSEERLVRFQAATHPNAPKKLQALFRFIGVSPDLMNCHPSLRSLCGLLSLQERLLIEQCGPFGASLFAVRNSTIPTRAGKPRLRHYRIGRGRKGTQFGHWRAIKAAGVSYSQEA